jgi:hypothetical protein
MKAVVDRFEGGYAVVLFGDEEIRVNVPRRLLPEDVREGSWLRVGFELDPGGTESQRKKIEGLLDRLKEKNKKNR